MDAERHLLADAEENVGHLGHGVLRVRHRHAVARDDEDLVGVEEEVGDRFGLDGEVGLLRLVLLVLLLLGSALAEAAGQHVHERAVHRETHDVGENAAAGGDDGARDDQQVVLQHEARGAAADAREGVQHGDDDGHVGASDGQHEEGAVDAGHHDEEEDEDEAEIVHVHHGLDHFADALLVVGGQAGEDHEDDSHHHEEDVPEGLSLDVHVPVLAVQLLASDDGTDEGDDADEDADLHEHDLDGGLRHLVALVQEGDRTAREHVL